MLKELMKEIIEAEKQAKQVMQEAFSEAKNIVDSADKSADKIIKEAKEYAFSDEKRMIEKAEADAEALYNDIISEGTIKAEEMSKSINLEKEADYIVNRLMKKHGCN